MREVQIERELYEPVQRFAALTLHHRLQERAPTGQVWIYEANTSAAGTEGAGQWSRPDVSALVLARGQYVPHWKADLHTFEVKTAKGLSETAVHEANSHSRFSNFAWLAFQALGKAAPTSETVFQRVKSLSAHLGVGLVHFENPDDPNGWTIELWPRPTSTDPAVVDGFVRDRFPNDVKQQISGRLRAFGWIGES